MALSIASNVLTVYKADTSDHKRKLKELRAEERSLAKEQLDGLEKRNTAFDKHIKMIGKVTLAVGATIAAFKLAQSAFNEYAKHSQLSTAAAGADLDRLKKASGGLRTEMELLDFAAGALNTTYALNNDEMAIALKASRSLTKQGNDANEVFKDMKKAIVEGATEPLKKYGINLDEVSGRQNKQIALMKALRAEAGKFGGDFSVAGDSMKKTQVSLSDSFSKIKIAIGELVAALGPLIIAMATIVSTIVTGLADAIALGGSSTMDTAQRALLAKVMGGPLSWRSGSGGMMGAAESALIRQKNPGMFDGEGAGQDGRSLFKIYGDQARANYKPRPTGGPGNPITREWDDPSGGGLRSAEVIGSVTSGIGSIGDPDSRTVNPVLVSAQLDELARQADLFTTEFVNNRNTSIMAAIFGPLEEFSAYDAAIKAAAVGADALASSVGAMYGAILDGQGGILKAGAEALKSVLKNYGTEMAILAVKETALGFASLALGPLGKVPASVHFKAAGMAAVGAVAAGVAVRGLGGAGASAGNGAAASASVRGRSGGDSAGGSNVSVYLGSDFADDSPRRSAARIRRAVDRATQAGGAPPVVYG